MCRIILSRDNVIHTRCFEFSIESFQSQTNTGETEFETLCGFEINNLIRFYQRTNWDQVHQNGNQFYPSCHLGIDDWY